MHHGSPYDDIKEEATGLVVSSTGDVAAEAAELLAQGQHKGRNGSGGSEAASGGLASARLETHSCPSSPTETDCSSGFSTLRRRSVTVTEKVCSDRRVFIIYFLQKMNGVSRPFESNTYINPHFGKKMPKRRR